LNVLKHKILRNTNNRINSGDFAARVPSGDEIYFPKRELSKKNYNDISVTLGDKSLSYSTIKNWVAGFRTGHLSIEDEERSGRPTQATISVNVDDIHSMIL
jgi:hypothetical protein